MGQSMREPDALVARPPYFFQDPIRGSAVLCTVLLMAVKSVPFPLLVFAVGLSQVNSLAMILDIAGRGWTNRWGRRARASVLAHTLALDWTNTSVCTLTGAMLLLKLFGPPSLVIVIGCLALAIALLPDVRVSRMMLPADMRQASRLLETGWFFRDPIKLGALCAMTIVCLLDRTSLAYVLISMGLLQLNAILLLVDKYIGEVEVEPRHQWIRSQTLRIAFARDGQRLMLMLLPIGLMPLRLLAGDEAARWACGAIAAIIVLPDVLRLSGRLVSGLMSWRARPVEM